jgi:hypothetical protein
MQKAGQDCNSAAVKAVASSVSKHRKLKGLNEKPHARWERLSCNQANGKCVSRPPGRMDSVFTPVVAENYTPSMNSATCRTGGNLSDFKDAAQIAWV